MLKTNSKIVRKKIQDWIMANTDFEGYDEYEGQKMTFDETAKALHAICEREKNPKHYASDEAMLTDWFHSAPPCLNTIHYLMDLYGKCTDVVGEILEQTAEERECYDNETAVSLIDHLIAMEILRSVGRRRIVETGKSV